MKCGVGAIGPVVVAATAATTPSSCGPSSAEIGAGVLVALPLIALAVLGVQAGFVWLWRRFRPTLGVSWVDPAWLVGGLAVLAALVAVAGGQKLDVFGIAFWLVGCSYATMTLVAMRVLFAIDAGPRLVVLAQALPAVLFAAPAIALLFTRGTHHVSWEDAYVGMCIYPGMGGWVPGTLALALVVEALIRGRRAITSR